MENIKKIVDSIVVSWENFKVNHEKLKSSIAPKPKFYLEAVSLTSKIINEVAAFVQQYAAEVLGGVEGFKGLEEEKEAKSFDTKDESGITADDGETKTTDDPKTSASDEDTTKKPIFDWTADDGNGRNLNWPQMSALPRASDNFTFPAGKTLHGNSQGRTWSYDCRNHLLFGEEKRRSGE